MNVQGSFVERRLGRPIMSGLHGMFSLGGMAGAVAAGAIAAAGVPLLAHFAVVALLTVAVAAWAARHMLPGDAAVGPRGAAFAMPPRALLPLGLMAFTVLLGEGAMADWSAVYLTNSLGAGPATAAAGFAAFSLAMAAGRFAGDWLTARFGPVRLLRAGAILAALGLAGGLAVGVPWAAVLGFGLVGAGLSCLFPVLIGVSTRVEGVAPGHAIAGIATLGYLGFLVGPPGIGVLAEHLGLAGALALVALLLLVNPVLAGRAAARR
jgi:fucose permease